MICTVIPGPSLDEVSYQIEKAKEHADMVELRLDLWDEVDTDTLDTLQKKYCIPILFTYKGADRDMLMQLAACKPSYIDVEDAINLPCKTIRSYHDYTKTPDDLDSILTSMPKADIYKIAVCANSILDTLRLMLWRKKQKR